MISWFQIHHFKYKSHPSLLPPPSAPLCLEAVVTVNYVLSYFFLYPETLHQWRDPEWELIRTVAFFREESVGWCWRNNNFSTGHCKLKGRKEGILRKVLRSFSFSTSGTAKGWSIPMWVHTFTLQGDAPCPGAGTYVFHISVWKWIPI